MEKEKINNDEFIEKVIKHNRKRMLSLYYRLGSVILIFIILISYLLSPISTLKHLTLEGNVYLKNADILKILNKEEKDSLYSISPKNTEDLLNAHPLIEEAKITLNPFKMHVNYFEIGFAYQQDEYYYTNLNKKYTFEEISDSQIFIQYLETKLIELNKLPKCLSNQDKLNKDYLSIVMFLSSLNAQIEYFSYLDNNSFKIYLKDNSNSNYLCVRFIYENKFSYRDYANQISQIKDRILPSFKLHEEEIDGKFIKSYHVFMELKEENSSLNAIIGGE